MLISLSNRFIVLHVNRAAGSSIIHALRSYRHLASASRLNRIVSSCGLHRDPSKIYFRPHVTAVDVRRLLSPRVYDGFFKAAFVRNPYSWLVSMYNSVLTGAKHRHAKRILAMSGFAEYVDWEIARGKRSIRRFVTDRDGEIIVDFIGRSETLGADFGNLCRILSLTAEPMTSQRNKREHADYRTFYDSETIGKVAAHWRRDLDMFGYDFDGVKDPRPVLDVAASIRGQGEKTV